MDNRFLTSRRTFDADATRYINAVQLADGQALEPEVAMAVDAFVKGCKADSAGYAGDPTRTVWDALQACCIMAGSRTISGALVPLVGDAPTPYNFTASDYSRTTGLRGDGSTTYLNSNRNNNADGQDDNHLAVYSTANPAITNRALAGEYYGPTTSGTQISQSGSSVWTRCRTVAADISLSFTTGLLGVSRASASSYTKRAGLQSSVVSTASVAPSSQDLFLFALHESGTASGHSDARLAFYSIGSAIPNLAALDNRVSTLISSIAAAIA